MWLFVSPFLFVQVLCVKVLGLKGQVVAKKKKPDKVRLYFVALLLLFHPPSYCRMSLSLGEWSKVRTIF